MKRPLVLVGTSLLAVAWFVWLRPTTLGGPVQYIVVDGTSMEPTYRDGDLVVVRQQRRYRPGDVIAFRVGGHFDDKTRVIHRIVGGDETAGFITRGDNRDETDPWRPTEADIIGRASLHIPSAGRIAAAAAQPESLAAMGGAAAVVGGERRRRRRRLPPPEPEGAPMTDRPEPEERRLAEPGGPRTDRSHRTPSWALIGLVLCGVLAVPTLAGAWSALRASDTTQRQETVGVVDYGIELGYTATGQPSAVYPTGSVEATKNLAGALDAGGPLYRRLLDRVDVDLRFALSAEGAERLDAAYSVDVEVRTPDGWSAPLDGVPLRPLDGDARQQVRIDLPSVAAQVAQIAELTGVGGATYSVVVTPAIEVAAGVDDTDTTDHLVTPLELSVDGDVITVTGADRAASSTLERTVVEEAQFDIGPFTTSTQTARAVLSGLALALIGGIVWFASVLFGGFGLHEPARIATRYRSQIVDVSVASAPPGPVVMVGSIEELARIAKVDQNVILHEDLGDGAHRYRVFLGTVTYEYETAPAHPGGVLAADVPDGGSS